MVSAAAIMGIQVIETAHVSLFKNFSFAGFHKIEAKGVIGNIEDQRKNEEYCKGSILPTRYTFLVSTAFHFSSGSLSNSL